MNKMTFSLVIPTKYKTFVDAVLLLLTILDAFSENPKQTSFLKAFLVILGYY